MKDKTKEILPQNDPKIFKGVRDFLKQLNESGDPPLESLTPTEARKVLEKAQENVVVDLSGITEEKHEIEEQGVAVKLIIIKPKDVKPKAGVFMFFHGGGWVLGDYPTHKRLVRDLVVDSGAVCVFVDYSRAPETKFPIAINEAYFATKWVYNHGKEIGVNSKNLALVGNSVGGNMATVIAMMACEKKDAPKIKFQALLWPVTNCDFNNETYKKYSEGRFLTTDMMKWFWDSYLKDEELRMDKHASPLQASLEDLAKMPPTLIQTAEHDVLRQEAEDYAYKLDEAGVEVTLTRYRGTIHDFGLLNPLSKERASKDAVHQVASLLKYYLYDID